MFLLIAHKVEGVIGTTRMTSVGLLSAVQRRETCAVLYWIN